MRSVVVTGVSSGIGEVAVRAFVVAGLFVFGSVRRQADALHLIQMPVKNKVRNWIIPLLLSKRAADRAIAKKYGLEPLFAKNV